MECQPQLDVGGCFAGIGTCYEWIRWIIGETMGGPATGEPATYPKIVALDTDWTIFSGTLDASTWGKGPDASQPVEDNIEQVDYWEIHDRTNGDNKCGMYPDIPNIISDILKNGAQLAIVSRNTSKGMVDRALWHWHVKDAYENEKRLVELVKYDEVYDQSKTEHFSKIKGSAGCHYTDMILFDDEAINNNVEMLLGVTFQVSRDQKGLTWENYQQGIDMWRRNKTIESPWLGTNLDSYQKRRFLGYSGMDIETIKLLEAGGRRHDRKEAARWGFAMYVADDPAIAKYFGEWIKKTTPGFSESIVCSIWARDGDIWDSMNKIWVPNKGNLQTNNVHDNEFDVAWSQEDRDRLVASWGVQKPYALLSRHQNMGTDQGLQFPVPNDQRWNELVIYPQIQEALIVINRMTDAELNEAIESQNHVHYEQQLHAWNITVPEETQQDFQAHGETIGQ